MKGNEVKATDQFFFFVEELDGEGDRRIRRKSSGVNTDWVIKQRRVSSEAEVDALRGPSSGQGVTASNWEENNHDKFPTTLYFCTNGAKNKMGMVAFCSDSLAKEIIHCQVLNPMYA